MDKTFDETIAGIRTAERGVEVREDIAQGMEYVKQYAEEVTVQKQAALQAAQTATGAASTATEKAAAAAESKITAQTAATNAAQSAQSASAYANSAESSAASAEESANRVESIVRTDKTLSVEGAPADAKATGNALKNIKLPVATATTLGGFKLSNDFTADADGKLHLAGGTAPDPYPVGSIYQSTNSTSPAALFGGSWEEIASERVLMGASSAHAAGTTVKAGLPNITGQVPSVKLWWNDKIWNISGSFAWTNTRPTEERYSSIKDGTESSLEFYQADFNASRSSAVYGRSSTVQPAAYYVHIWHRVA